ncbi:MAG: TIGR02147 family protein [Fibrobacteria bacterium]|nr:TIGR02147 family protein [Fibrobacteria bacterium]
MADAPDIFAYIDYRRWLADLSSHLKESTRYFSHRWFAQAAGIANPSIYSQVVSGKRRLTPPLVEVFAKVLELSAKQNLFLHHLVEFTHARTALEKQEHYAVLRELGGSVHQTRLGPDAWDFYRHWWIPALRELVAQRGSFRDWKSLAGQLRPPISARQARQGVETLVRLGLLTQGEDGRWRQSTLALTSGDEVGVLAVRKHNAEMIRLGEESIERFPPASRHVSGITAGLSPAAFQVLVAEIEAFRERVVRLVTQDDAPGEVYQFNLQLFPLSSSEES